MKKLLIAILIFSGCNISEDDGIKSKGVVTGFFETKNASNTTSIKMSIQDTSGKIFFAPKKICATCLVGDSVKLRYHDISIIEDNGDKYEIDSCVKFSNSQWKPERYTKTLYFYDDSGRLIKKIDTTFIK